MYQVEISLSVSPPTPRKPQGGRHGRIQKKTARQNAVGQGRAGHVSNTSASWKAQDTRPQNSEIREIREIRETRAIQKVLAED